MMPSLAIAPQLACTRICKTFTALAQRTWTDIGDAYLHRMHLNETSITDYLLLDLKRSHSDEVRIWKVSQSREAKCGGDWAWWFVGKRTSYGMLVQAKVLDVRRLRYNELARRVGKPKDRQIDVLITAAKGHTYKGQAHPLQPAYCFYNHWLSAADDPTWKCMCPPPDRSLFGCSIADARRVRQCVDAKTADLDSIGRLSYPWSCLVCCRAQSASSPTETTRSVGQLLGGDNEIPALTDGPPPYILELAEADSQSKIDGILRGIGVVGVMEIRLPAAAGSVSRAT